MSPARPPEATRIAARRAEVTLSSARPSEGARTAARGAEVTS